MTTATATRTPIPAGAIDLAPRVRLAAIQTYNAETRTVRVMWSRGSEVVRFDWWEWEYYIESLDMSPAAVDLTRMEKGAPVLDAHQRGRLADQIGVIERAWLDNGEGYADIRFSNREDLAWLRQDVADGIIRNVSVGYDVRQMTPDGYDETTGYPRMIVSDWQPFEISLVPVGADPDAGTRARSLTDRPRTRCVIRGTPVSQPAAPAAITRQEHTMPEAVTEHAGPATTAPDIKIIQDQARDAETARVRDISAVGEQWNFREQANDYIREGKTAAAFREWVMDQIRTQNREQVAATREIGLTDREVRDYSVNRALAAMLAESEGKRDAWNAAGFERECHQAVMTKRGLEPQHGGFFVPWEIQARKLLPRNARALALADPWAFERLVRDLQHRDMTVAGVSGSNYLVGTDNLAGSFIDMLRAELVMAELGVTVIDGLQGQVTIPKQSAGSTMYYPANEGTAITESQPTLGQVSLSAKHAGVYVEISRALLLQSNPAADALTIEDIRRVIGIGVDTGIYAGSGSPQPTGLTGTGSIGSVTGTSLAYAGVVEFQTDVATANGLDDSCAYLTTPAVAGLLMQRQRFSSTDSPLWTGTVRQGTLAGYRARASTLVTAATMAFGAWRQMILALWGDLELARSDFANFPAGIVGFRGFISYDVGCRQPGAFSVATSIT